jgi:hypothetical protein
MFVNREKAHELYTKSSREFVENFLKERPGAHKVRSREAAAAWNAIGAVGYFSLAPWQPYWTQPDSLLGPAPLLVRVQVNFRPPPGLFYILRSRPFREKLGVRPETPLLEAPQLELIADPEELLPFAKWLADWECGQAGRSSAAPRPPSPFHTAEANYDFRGDDGRWLFHEALWTRPAYQQYESWFTIKKG